MKEVDAREALGFLGDAAGAKLRGLRYEKNSETQRHCHFLVLSCPPFLVLVHGAPERWYPRSGVKRGTFAFLSQAVWNAETDDDPPDINNSPAPVSGSSPSARRYLPWFAGGIPALVSTTSDCRHNANASRVPATSPFIKYSSGRHRRIGGVVI